MRTTTTEPQHVRLKPNRDGLTWLSYVQMAAWAVFLYGFGATQALLRDEQGLSTAIAGLYATAFALAGIVGGLASSPLVAKLGRGQVLRLSAVGTAAGIVIYTWPGASFPLALTGLFALGVTGTLMLIAVNAFILAHQRAAGPAALTEANAIAAGAGLFGPIIVGVGAATFLGWRSGILAVAGALIVIEVVRGRNVSQYGEAGSAEHAEHRATRLPRPVYWSLALVMFFLGTEFSMTFWGADLLREHAGFGPAAAAASVASIVSGMLVGRIVGARLAQRIPSETLLRASIVVALAGFLLAWVPTNPVLVLAGLLITGFGISVHWPLGVARTVRLSNGMTDRATALSSLFGSFAMAIAPFALGALADALGFHLAFLMVPVLLGSALAILLLRPAPEGQD